MSAPPCQAKPAAGSQLRAALATRAASAAAGPPAPAATIAASWPDHAPQTGASQPQRSVRQGLHPQRTRRHVSGMPDPTLTHDLTALAQVVLIDMTLAGDNAVVVGLAVTGLPAKQRRPAIVLGIAAATAIRVALGTIALTLLDIIGLLLAGGLLLLWVCWRMYRELRRYQPRAAAPAHKTLRQAVLQIVLADLSMSLDNVLAVAGAAFGSPFVLAAGLVLSVVLMGVAANLLATLLERQRWIAWAGLLIVLYVALHMIWQGACQVAVALAR